jgi:hypothetical protein
MSYVYYNPNPDNKSVGDCTVRALTILFNDTWDNVYADLTMQGSFLHDMPSANAVWGEYLKLNGFTKHTIPDTCPSCYTIRQFAYEHPYGTYLLETGQHVVAAIDGNYFDTSDTGNEVPIYYWRKER